MQVQLEVQDVVHLKTTRYSDVWVTRHFAVSHFAVSHFARRQCNPNPNPNTSIIFEKWNAIPNPTLTLTLGNGKRRSGETRTCARIRSTVVFVMSTGTSTRRFISWFASWVSPACDWLVRRTPGCPSSKYHQALGWRCWQSKIQTTNRRR